MEIDEKELNHLGELWLAEISDKFRRRKNGKELGSFITYYKSTPSCDFKFSPSNSSSYNFKLDVHILKTWLRWKLFRLV